MKWKKLELTIQQQIQASSTQSRAQDAHSFLCFLDFVESVPLHIQVNLVSGVYDKFDGLPNALRPDVEHVGY